MESGPSWLCCSAATPILRHACNEEAPETAGAASIQ